MKKYIGKRIISFLIVLVGVSILSFLLIAWSGKDPAKLLHTEAYPILRRNRLR